MLCGRGAGLMSGARCSGLMSRAIRSRRGAAQGRVSAPHWMKRVATEPVPKRALPTIRSGMRELKPPVLSNWYAQSATDGCRFANGRRCSDALPGRRRVHACSELLRRPTPRCAWTAMCEPTEKVLRWTQKETEAMSSNQQAPAR